MSRVFLLILASPVLATALCAQSLPVDGARPTEAPAARAGKVADAIEAPATEGRAERPARRCLRYQQQVDEAKMQRIGNAAAQRGVGVVWVNPPTRRVCVSWA